MKEQEGLRFVSLEAENFKNIDKRVVDINGRSLLIMGKNEKGKSTLIQALLSGIDPKIQATDIIKKGETKGHTKVVIAGTLNGKEEQYSLEMFYTPGNQTGRIVLRNSKDEIVKSPKEVLKSIIGNMSFDIFAFLKARKPDQIKILKELSGVAPEINKLDMERKKLFEERAFLKRTTDESEAVMNNHGLSPEDIDLYSEEIDVAPLHEDMANISKKITTWNGVKTKTEEFRKEAEGNLPDMIHSKQKSIDSYNQSIAQLKQQISSIEADIVSANESITTYKIKIDEAKANVEKGNAWLEKNPEPNASAISESISHAVEHNERCKKVTDLAARQKALFENKNKLVKMDQDIDTIDAKKDSVIKKSKLPIKGLSFTDENIFLDGIPLEENQVNTAKLIDVGVEISMALNPNLRTIFIHEGSLFDKEALENLIKKVEKRGYQLIVELVTESEELEIKFTEKEVE